MTGWKAILERETVKIAKTVFVGGPAHGKVGNDIITNGSKVSITVATQADSLVMTGQGIQYASQPYETHVYKVRKMALSETFGKRKIYELLIHEGLWDDVRSDALGLANDNTYRRLMDAVLDAMFKAFL